MIDVLLFMSLGTLLTAAAAIVVFTCAVILFGPHIISWFKKHSEVINADASKVAFTLKEKMTSGDCSFVQGVFDQTTEKVIEVRRIESQQVDDELREVHAAKTLAIYQ